MPKSGSLYYPWFRRNQTSLRERPPLVRIHVTVMGALALVFPGCFASLHAQDSTFQLRGVSTSAPPVIDGSVDDLEWRGAAIADGFMQFEPHRGEPADHRTEVLVLYDSNHLYVGFRMWDPYPPAAQLTRRDANLQEDDAVGLLLDSHYDRQSAYFFMTNALGTQFDGRIANDGRTTDPTWDAPWRTAASRTEFGWSAEMAIPFTSIQYAAGRNRTWGINFLRTRRRSLEATTWAGPLDNIARVSQGGALVGLDVPPPERRHQIITYGLTRIQEDTADTWDAGVDARYAITPQVSAYGTVNPDFATIEADQEQINLTRFELSLPEKRPFFLEGSELYRQRIRTFYSRRIPDIKGGAQVLGTQGAWKFAGLAAVSEPADGEETAGYGVGRLQRAIGNSNIALTVANRSLEGEQRGSLGMDATLFFTGTLGATAQLVQSWGPSTGGSWAYFIRPAYDSPTGHFHVRYTHLGSRFADNANAIGFVRDDDRRELDSALRRTFWIRRGLLERFVYGSNYNVYWSQGGLLRSWQVDQSVDVELRNRLSLRTAHTEEFKRFEEDFRNRNTQFRLGYNTREFQSAAVGFRFGRNFNADFRLWTAGGGYKVTEELSVEYELQRLWLDPDPDGESTWIHVVRANQFFTNDLYLRVFFQTNSAIERENIQAVFVYRYRPPFGTVQVAYQRGTAEFGESSGQGNTLFLKGTWVF